MKDGGAAFLVQAGEASGMGPRDMIKEGYGGMTLRDYFAAHANEEDIQANMPQNLGEIYDWGVEHGYLPKPNPNPRRQTPRRMEDTSKVPRSAMRAWARYKHADAMLAAREGDSNAPR